MSLEVPVNCEVKMSQEEDTLTFQWVSNLIGVRSPSIFFFNSPSVQNITLSVSYNFSSCTIFLSLYFHKLFMEDNQCSMRFSFGSFNILESSMYYVVVYLSPILYMTSSLPFLAKCILRDVFYSTFHLPVIIDNILHHCNTLSTPIWVIYNFDSSEIMVLTF